MSSKVRTYVCISLMSKAIRLGLPHRSGFAFASVFQLCFVFKPLSSNQFLLGFHQTRVSVNEILRFLAVERDFLGLGEVLSCSGLR